MDVQEIPSILPERWAPILENYTFKLFNPTELEYAQTDTAVYCVKFFLRFTCKENRSSELPLSVVNWSSSDIPTRIVLAETAELEALLNDKYQIESQPAKTIALEFVPRNEKQRLIQWAVQRWVLDEYERRVAKGKNQIQEASDELSMNITSNSGEIECQRSPYGDASEFFSCNQGELFFEKLQMSDCLDSNKLMIEAFIFRKLYTASIIHKQVTESDSIHYYSISLIALHKQNWVNKEYSDAEIEIMHNAAVKCLTLALAHKCFDTISYSTKCRLFVRFLQADFTFTLQGDVGLLKFDVPIVLDKLLKLQAVQLGPQILYQRICTDCTPLHVKIMFAGCVDYDANNADD